MTHIWQPRNSSLEVNINKNTGRKAVKKIDKNSNNSKTQQTEHVGDHQFPTEALPPVLQDLCEDFGRDYGIHPSVTAAIGLTLMAGAARDSTVLECSSNSHSAEQFSEARRSCSTRLKSSRMQGPEASLFIADAGKGSLILDLMLRPFYIYQHASFLAANSVATTDLKAEAAIIEEALKNGTNCESFPGEACLSLIEGQRDALDNLLRKQIFTVNRSSAGLEQAQFGRTVSPLSIWTKSELFVDCFHHPADLVGIGRAPKPAAVVPSCGEPDLVCRLPLRSDGLIWVACCNPKCLGDALLPVVESEPLRVILCEETNSALPNNPTGSSVLAQARWNESILKVLDNPHGRWSPFCLPPRVHGILVERARGISESSKGAPRSLSVHKILDACCHMTLVLHLLGHWRRPDVCVQTAEDAVVLVRWFLRERARIVQTLANGRTEISARRQTRMKV
jgi:hypothetical protein